MSRIDAPRGNDDGTPLRSGVIEDPGESSGDEGKNDESALSDQRSSAGDRTRTEIATSAKRRPVSGVSTSILNTTSYAMPAGARRGHAVRNGFAPDPAEATASPGSPAITAHDRTKSSRSSTNARR